MKVFRIPENRAAILFDMDGTLYTHDEYMRLQLELPVRRLARLKGKSLDEMNAEIAHYREAYAASHGGRAISLGNVFAAFGVPIAESVRWREELYEPERYLSEDKKLRITLEKLAAPHPAGRSRLAVITNNPVSVARRTLAALGIGEYFTALVGLDTCGVSKPHEAPFLKAAELCGACAADCLSVGDRYDIDIALPLELGMGGILASGVQDVYALPELLA
jgi:phosphoglycolate phosphatase/putative hydrolase of the HAD superfamily